MKLVLVIIKVKYRIMTSHIQYKMQYYLVQFQYKFRPNRFFLVSSQKQAHWAIFSSDHR